MSTFTTAIQLCIEVLPTANKQEKEVKGTQIGKEGVKLSLISDDMILHIGNQKESTNKQTQQNCRVQD